MKWSEHDSMTGRAWALHAYELTEAQLREVGRLIHDLTALCKHAHSLR